MQSARAMDRAAGPLADGERLIVRGQVQGVGFRPTVWRVASQLGLTGSVRNTAEGVAITVWGENRSHFADRLVSALPPLARIDTLERTTVSGIPPEAFTIAPSETGAARAAITPDVAVCGACVSEIADPTARRQAYPFTNCTDCGPRFSIQQAVPYDRHNTTMASFALCKDCQAEYDNPADRRFHAEPIACPNCGPKASLEWLGENTHRPPLDGKDPVAEAARLLKAGFIVAIKGLGGIHLACDATQADAVQRLRTRKGREGKAFALMARDTTVIARHAKLSADNTALLTAPSAPIVLFEALAGTLPDAIAPGLDTLGFMLPYTPLHVLLMEGFETPIVMTSGNRSGAPQVIDNDEARIRLAGLADAALLHNRPIARRIDDSVVRVDCGAARVLRRARGFAPIPLALPEGFDGTAPVLAMGSELKNTFCLTKDGEALLSHHMGDLEDAHTHQDTAHNLALYADLFQHTPAVVAVDLHPDYLSTKRGRDLAGSRPVVAVQHHHAHIAACLAENGRPAGAPPVVGIAMDGLGLGPD
ncbi:MAG: carbamoyltransferase HypF, partial [Pseudomonadota bacterium]